STGRAPPVGAFVRRGGFSVSRGRETAGVGKLDFARQLGCQAPRQHPGGRARSGSVFVGLRPAPVAIANPRHTATRYPVVVVTLAAARRFFADAVGIIV